MLGHFPHDTKETENNKQYIWSNQYIPFNISLTSVKHYPTDLNLSEAPVRNSFIFNFLYL